MTRRPTPKTPKPRLVTRAELARQKGVSRAAVSLACGEGGPLSDSVHAGKVDIDDPSVIAWLAEPVRGPDSTTPEGDASPGGVVAPTKAEMLALTKRKREAEARRLELANAATEGKIISRALVSTFIIGAIDRMTKRLLGDITKGIAARVTSNARGGGSLEESIRIVRTEISRQIELTKATVARLLKERGQLEPQIAAPPAPKKRSRRRK